MSQLHFRLQHVFFILALILAALVFQTAAPAHADTAITLNTDDDTAISGDGYCTLREAINNANAGADTTGGDCATSSSGFIVDEGYNVTLQSQLPTITGQVTILATPHAALEAGDCDPVTRPGGCTPAGFRIFNIAPGGTLGLSNMILRYGSCTGGCETDGKDGGAILVRGALSLESTTLDSNLASGKGGGIYNLGVVQAGYVNLINNRSGANGGGAIATASESPDTQMDSLCIAGNTRPAMVNLKKITITATSSWWGVPDGPASAGSDGVKGAWDTTGWATSSSVACQGGPFHLSATPTGPAEMTVSWDDDATDETGFSLERSADGKTGWAEVATAAANATSAVDSSGLACGERVYYRARAVKSGVYSRYSNVLSAQTRVCPPALTSPKPGAPVYSALTPYKLTWKSVKGASSYHVQIGQDSTFADYLVDGYPTKPSLADIEPFGVWYWRVASVDASGQSDYGAVSSYEITINKSPKKNATLKSGVVTFTWMPVKGVTYQLRINDETAHIVYFQTSTPLTKPFYKLDKASPLPPGNYSWQVDAGQVDTHNNPIWTPAWPFAVQ